MTVSRSTGPSYTFFHLALSKKTSRSDGVMYIWRSACSISSNATRFFSILLTGDGTHMPSRVRIHM